MNPSFRNKYICSLIDSQMKIFLITIGLLALAIGGIAIKLWAKKDGKFAGTCASQNPHLNKEGEACGYCGKLPENCDNK